MDRTRNTDQSNRGAGPSTNTKDSTRQAAESARDSAREGAEQVTEQAKGKAESMKAEAGDQAQRTASALESAADELAAEDQTSLAETVSSLAKRLSEFASQIENKSVDELLNDAGRFAQREPLLFVAGSVAAGAMLSRFFRAHQPPGAESQSTGAGQSDDFDFGDDRTEQDYAFDERAAAEVESATSDRLDAPGVPLRTEPVPESDASKDQEGGKRA